MRSRTPARWRWRTLAVVLALVATLIAPALLAAASSSQQLPSYQPGRVLVSFKRGTSAATKAAVHQRLGAQLLRSIPQIDVDVVQVPEGSELAAVAAYKSDPAVEDAGLAVLGHFDAVPPTVPNDPRFGQQWYLQEIRAPQAWTLVSGSRVRPVIAVIDSGLLAGHQDLSAGQIVLYRDFTDCAPSPGPGCGLNDPVGHGTQVTGVIAATHNNMRGIAGVCPQCRMIVLSVDNNAGTDVDPVAIIGALVFAADRGAQIINGSWGIPYSTLTPGTYTALNRAMQYVLARGVLFVNSAGNDFDDPSSVPKWPQTTWGGHPQVLIVGATGPNRQVAPYSNRTYMPNGGFRQVVDLGAPGGGACSGNPSQDILMPSNTGGYSATCGTSFASPITAGVAGLVLASGICSTASCLKQRIISTADSVPALAAAWPNGRFLNACRAVDSLNGIRC
ncbi:Thermophilic serine proteinase [bacterium HR27]|nr:Thermophilic serine proteinase [bacterium HR27]